MGCDRENANIWWHLFRSPRFFKRKYRTPLKKIVRSPYFWQDSFFTHWNRWIGCRKQHKRLQNLGCGEGWFCFACYRSVKEPHAEHSS